MPGMQSLFWVVSVFLLGYSHADPEFCDRGFQISGKFHSCWTQATLKKPFTPLGVRHSEYTPKLLEEYASHMCSKVKPMALKCLAQEILDCADDKKLLETADASGGACEGDHLNPFFKKHVIDHLKPIKGDSPCFNVADQAYMCYEQAAEKTLQSGASHVDISRFHKVADKFFGYIWDCHVDLFRNMSDVCEHWQIPMLFSLQQTAMPSLFGMRLNNYQISQLQLERNGSKPAVVPTTAAPPEKCGEERVTSYLMIRVIKDRKEARPGDIVVQLDAGGDYQTELTVDGGPSLNKDVIDFVSGIINPEGGIDMRALRRKMREDRKKQKELNDYLKRIKSPDQRRKKKKVPPKNPKNSVNVEGMVN